MIITNVQIHGAHHVLLHVLLIYFCVVEVDMLIFYVGAVVILGTVYNVWVYGGNIYT